MARNERQRRLLESRIHRLWGAQTELRAAQEDADKYAAELLSVEYGLLVGEVYEFKTEAKPEGFRARITRAEGYLDQSGARLMLHVYDSSIRTLISEKDFPQTFAGLKP